MNELSLFTGAGGGLLGTKLLGWKTIGYVEKKPYCQKVIRQRIADGFLDAAPIFGDIRKFISEGYAASYTGLVDVITAGFPCQPFSVAGKRGGGGDERNMWPETIGCIRIIRPRFAFLENVPGLLAHKYIQRIFGDLAESGYDARWFVLGADDVGAPHRRKRLWILAYSSGNGRPARREDGREHDGPIVDTNGQYVSYTKKQGLEGEDATGNIRPDGWTMQYAKCHGWPTEPDVGRVAHGVASRVDRLKAIGNGQVPSVAALAWRLLA